MAPLVSITVQGDLHIHVTNPKALKEILMSIQNATEQLTALKATVDSMKATADKVNGETLALLQKIIDLSGQAGELPAEFMALLNDVTAGAASLKAKLEATDGAVPDEAPAPIPQP